VTEPDVPRLPPPHGDSIGRWHLDHHPASAALARVVVRESLSDPRHPVSEQLRHRAVLATSELVANAVRHGRPPLDLEISRSGSGWVVAVYDGEPAAPLRRTVGQMSESGRGLLIVDRSTERSGWAPHGDGKVVWVEVLERDAPA
jgi:anti-sigma regulatory factor (Ser/Thr protein kinase)